MAVRKPFRKFVIEVDGKQIFAIADGRRDSLDQFVDMGYVVTVQHVKEVENELGIPIRRGRTKKNPE